MFSLPELMISISSVFLAVFLLQTGNSTILKYWENTAALIFQAFSFVILFLTPISNYIHLVFVLIGMDLITGSYASHKEGEHFKASKLKKTGEKFLFYSMVIITAYLLQIISGDDGTQLARIAALFVSSIEVKSSFENISRILDIAPGSLWEAIYNKIKESINKKGKS